MTSAQVVRVRITVYVPREECGISPRGCARTTVIFRVSDGKREGRIEYEGWDGKGSNRPKGVTIRGRTLEKTTRSMKGLQIDHKHYPFFLNSPLLSFFPSVTFFTPLFFASFLDFVAFFSFLFAFWKNLPFPCFAFLKSFPSRFSSMTIAKEITKITKKIPLLWGRKFPQQ